MSFLIGRPETPAPLPPIEPLPPLPEPVDPGLGAIRTNREKIRRAAGGQRQIKTSAQGLVFTQATTTGLKSLLGE